jgi:beta-alanine degradation protein BauB
MSLSLNRVFACTAVALGLFAAVRAQTAANQTHREDQLQNDDVKVWRTTILPHQPLSMHRHDHPRVIVALTDGNVDIVDVNGTHDLHVWKQNHAYWLPAMPPGAMHSDVNTGNAPIQVMVVELEKEQ